MILEEIIRSLRDRLNLLNEKHDRERDPEERAYLEGRIVEVKEILAKLENIA